MPFQDTPGIENKIIEITAGYGCDAVIITAASSSFDPINFAGSISKKKGTIVVSGAVPTGFDREPNFYQKELTVKMSCSYGPGRYDPTYEEKGRDYPYAYVRWTEKRNMQAFQELIVSGRIDVNYLTTHTYSFAEVPKAYDMIMERSEPFIGILIEYDRTKEISRKKVNITESKSLHPVPPRVAIGFIGAGSYAQSYLLPNIPKNKDIILKGVMTSSSTGSRSVADRFGFEYCTGNVEDILENNDINTVFIATRHDSHGKYTIDALLAGKNVFVEKPLCLNSEELREIEKICNSKNHPMLMVGFNRRFSPISEVIKEKIVDDEMAMLYRINAGIIPAESWIQDPDIGGGRILGELCHFIDYLTWVNGSLPVFVYAATMADPQNLQDTLAVSLKYQNGSVGSILYLANGSTTFGKEYIEVHQRGSSVKLNDFKEIAIYGTGKPHRKKLSSPNKGQKNEVRVFLQAVKGERPIPIPFEQIVSATNASFGVVESIKTGKVVPLI